MSQTTDDHPRAAAAILKWISGSSPQSTADPSGTDAAAPAFARGGRNFRDVAPAVSPERQGTPFPTNTLVPGRPNHFSGPCNLPPHLAFRLTNIIMRDSTRTSSLIRRHTRFHPQNILSCQRPTVSRPSRHFVCSTRFLHPRSSLSAFIQPESNGWTLFSSFLSTAALLSFAPRSGTSTSFFFVVSNPNNSFRMTGTNGRGSRRSLRLSLILRSSPASNKPANASSPFEEVLDIALDGS